MLDTAYWAIKVLGHEGFSAKCIQRKVKTYSGGSYSLSTIYKILSHEGISLRKYRDGKTQLAKQRIAVSLGTKKGKRAG